MLYAHGPDLCHESDLKHAMANCFEALLGTDIHQMQEQIHVQISNKGFRVYEICLHSCLIYFQSYQYFGLLFSEILYGPVKILFVSPSDQ